MKPWRIMIDARSITPISHGIGIYTRFIINELKNIDRKNLYFILISEDASYLFKNLPKNFRIITTSSPFIRITDILKMNPLIKKLKIDLLHQPSFWLPYKPTCKFVITIHDLNHLVYWKEYSIFHFLYYKIILRKRLLEATAIITVSHFSQTEIELHYPEAKSKVNVIYEGPGNLVDTEKSVFIPFKKFFLSIGNKKFHKNLKYVEGIFRKIKENLVIVGSSPESTPTKSSNIHYLNNISDAQLNWLYKHCIAVICPSIYEGFGFTPLEALKRGVPPIVNKNNKCFCEILQESVKYFTPEKHSTLIEAIEEMKDEKKRKKWIEKGEKHVEKFSWKECAIQHYNLYLRCLNSN